MLPALNALATPRRPTSPSAEGNPPGLPMQLDARSASPAGPFPSTKPSSPRSPLMRQEGLPAPLAPRHEGSVVSGKLALLQAAHHTKGPSPLLEQTEAARRRLAKELDPSEKALRRRFNKAFARACARNAAEEPDLSLILSAAGNMFSVSPHERHYRLPFFKEALLNTVGDLTRWAVEKGISAAMNSAHLAPPDFQFDRKRFSNTLTDSYGAWGPFISLLATLTGYTVNEMAKAAFQEYRKLKNPPEIPRIFYEQALTDKVVTSFQELYELMRSSDLAFLKAVDKAVRVRARAAAYDRPGLFEGGRDGRLPEYARKTLWNQVYEPLADSIGAVRPIPPETSIQVGKIKQSLTCIADMLSPSSSEQLQKNFVHSYGQPGCRHFHLFTGARSTCEEVAKDLVDAMGRAAYMVWGLQQALNPETLRHLADRAIRNPRREVILVVQDAAAPEDGETVSRLLTTFGREGTLEMSSSILDVPYTIKTQCRVIMLSNHEKPWEDSFRMHTGEFQNFRQRMEITPIVAGKKYLAKVAKESLEHFKEEFHEQYENTWSLTSILATNPDEFTDKASWDNYLKNIIKCAEEAVLRLLPQLLEICAVHEISFLSMSTVVGQLFRRASLWFMDLDDVNHGLDAGPVDSELTRLMEESISKIQSTTAPLYSDK